jgi:exonuclease SbcD
MKKRGITLLHTSDWHLGRMLYSRKRYEEFEAFLEWLLETLKREEVDVLLVAGDIFDTTLPSNRAQNLYYHFLSRVAATGCQHVVITGGNHDSPTFLNAPRDLLGHLGVHVIGAVCENIEDEVLQLGGTPDLPELIVCAVPYLRDRDVRSVRAGESTEDKARNLINGVQEHYARVTEHAESIRAEQAHWIPIVAMGHLFTAGGVVEEGDGVRELYVGSLAHVNASIFPESIDYLALGHLHVPQKVGGDETRRYCGSPIPMGFGEAKQEKSLSLVSFDLGDRTAPVTPTVRTIPIPLFQKLEQIRGDLSAIKERIEALKKEQSSVWLEVIYDGEELIADLPERINLLIEGSALEVLKSSNLRRIEGVLERFDPEESLVNLDSTQVFGRLLDEIGVEESQRSRLNATYAEIIQTLEESDLHAE